MKDVSRRQVLKGTAKGAAVTVVLPMALGPIPGLTDISTLEQLAAEGKFASSDLQLPQDLHSADFTFYLDDVKQEDGYIKEVYAPGDSSGWAVIYAKSKPHTGETELIRGNWAFTKTRNTLRKG